jgi:SAM-dependent methyltransferase
MLSALEKEGAFKALYIGYNQRFEDRLSRHVIQLDIQPRKYVDLVAAGEYVPFPSRSFNLVVISGVIEHVQYPFKVVEEAHRLLKSGGRLYVSSPWVYPYHGGDNYRFSHEGLIFLCHKFRDIEIGSLNGPLHSLGIFLYTLFTEYFSFGNRYVRFALSPLMSWLVFPFMLIDALVNKTTKSRYSLDANLYAIATKES